MGIEKLLGVLQGVQMDEFYKDLFDKAAYLLVQINKGHFFSNGNKRLALVMLMGFININDYHIKNLPKEDYKNKIKSLFPKFDDFQDFNDFSPEEFGI
ncbi:MAG: type II toxin-antitoxin system death-on-curing family toxin, partial [Nanoarchaeota archaeon]